ncbi:MAG: transcriptional repressor [Acidimicrobiales bacterium]|nr:transcriptional repressor [Acidimicrobiales bacterium]
MILNEIHQRVKALLEAESQRYTKERRRIVEALAQASRPITVESLRELDPPVPLSSAYRNLAVLERAGVAVRVQTAEPHARFELSERVTEHHHHHLVCTSCGAVEDFTVPHSLERSLSRRLGELARVQGFRAAAHRLDLVGTCRSCA